MSIPPRRPVVIASAVCCVIAMVILVASCGSGAEGDDTSDPRVVAKAYTTAAFECGERGAGKQYDLSTSPNRDWSRDTYLDLQRKAGCKPQRAPDLQVALIQQRGDFAAVEVVAEPTNASQNYRPARFLLVRVDGKWKVDTSRSDESEIRP
jgi:Putative lumazine-binding